VLSFDAINHQWMIRFLEHRIADNRVLRLIRKWLKAGVIENGEWKASEEGSPQGSSISPLLTNVYPVHCYPQPEGMTMDDSRFVKLVRQHCQPRLWALPLVTVVGCGIGLIG
jgi:hypothetical protein